MSDGASQVGEIEAAAYEAHRGHYRTACEWLDQATLMVVTAAGEANRRPAQPDKAHGLVLHQTIAIMVRAVRSLRLLVAHGYPIEAFAMLRLATEAEENFAHLLKDRSGNRALRWG